MNDILVKRRMLVTELSYRHITRLISFLEQGRSWYVLGRTIFQDDIISKYALDTFHNGGDSPTTRFIESLIKRRPDITLNEFYDTAIRMGRRDLSEYIVSLGNDHVRLKDLLPEKMNRIAMILDKNIPGINDWRMFADTFKYSYMEIEMLRQSNRPVQKPSECLFALLRGKYPLMTVEELAKHMKRISRNDIVEYLSMILY